MENAAITAKELDEQLAPCPEKNGLVGLRWDRQKKDKRGLSTTQTSPTDIHRRVAKCIPDG